MKYYETSAFNGNNIENMFFAMIDEINILQQARRKKTVAEDDPDANPPLTTENLKSERMTTKANDTEAEREADPNIKLKKDEEEKSWRSKFCCLW